MKKILFTFFLILLSSFYAKSQFTYLTGDDTIVPNADGYYSYISNQEVWYATWHYDTSLFEVISGGTNYDNYIILAPLTSTSSGYGYVGVVVYFSDGSSWSDRMDVYLKSKDQFYLAGIGDVYYGVNETYTAMNAGNYDLKWEVDGNYLETVSTSGSKIVVKGKKSSGSTIIRVNALSKVNGSLVDYATIRVWLKETPYTITTNGVARVCNNEYVTYTANKIPQGATIVWSAVANCSLYSSNGTTATFKAKAGGNGYMKVQAVITVGTSKPIIENSQVWVGVPEKPRISEFGSIPKGFVGRARYTLSAGAAGADLTDGFIYSISGAASITQVLIGGQFTIETNSVVYDTPFTIGVIARNKCGQSTIYYANGIVKGSGGGDEPPLIEMRGGFSIVDLKDQPEIKSVKIYNLSGVLVYSDNAVNGSFDIKSTVLTDGVYIIEKFDGENRTSEKVMLKR